MWLVRALAWLVFLATSLRFLLTAVGAVRMYLRVRPAGLGVKIQIPPRLLVAWLVCGVLLLIL